jgi:hypothetical protein
MHLTGLVHDLGKVLAHPAFGAQPQWAVVGDTFPTGLAPDPCVVYHHLFQGNPDLRVRAGPAALAPSCHQPHRFPPPHSTPPPPRGLHVPAPARGAARAPHHRPAPLSPLSCRTRASRGPAGRTARAAAWAQCE